MKKPKIPFPKTGSNKEQLLRSLEKYRSKDIDWRKGKAFCLVYYPGDQRAQLIKSIYDEFYAENALNPSATPTLTRMEGEVISMWADLFNGDSNVRGNITSGGTESILLAVKTARDWAKKHKPQIKHPEVIIPSSAHPAFIKAFKYFELDFVVVPVKDFRADPIAMEWSNYLYANGGRFHDENWHGELTSDAAKQALKDYIHNLQDHGPIGAASFSFDEAFNEITVGRTIPVEVLASSAHVRERGFHVGFAFFTLSRP